MYYFTLSFPFFSDDFVVVKRLMQGDLNGGIFFRPLGDISIYLDIKFFGKNAAWFHLHSILIHGFTSFLVFKTVWHLQEYLSFKYKPKIVALLTGIFFLLYAFHVEAVIWIVGRGIMLSTLWGCLCLLIYLKYGKSGHGYIGSLACFAISLLGYETALILPALLAMLVYFKTRTARKSLVVASGYLLIVALYVILRFLFSGNALADEYFRVSSGISSMFYNYVAVFTRSFSPPNNNSYLFLGIAIGVLGAVSASFIYLKLTIPGIFRQAFGLLLLQMISILPLITVGIDTHDYEGGRFIYQSSIFTCLLLAFILVNIVRRKFFLGIGVFAFCAIHIAILVSIKNDWSFAGKLIRNTLHNEYKFGTKNIFLNVPDSRNGAFIFRNGLREALILENFLTPLDSITVINYDYDHIFPNADSLEKIYQSNKDIILINRNGQAVNIKTKSDSLFYFTGSGLKKFKLKN